MLINRVADTDVRWHEEVKNAAPRVSPAIDLVLDDVPLKRAIDNLNLIKIRCKHKVKRIAFLPLSNGIFQCSCFRFCFSSLLSHLYALILGK